MKARQRVLAQAGIDRRPARASDVEALFQLGADIGRGLGGEPLFSREDLAAGLRPPGSESRRDSTLLYRTDGSVAGYALVYDDVPGRSDVEVIVDPALPAQLSTTVLDELLEWALESVAAAAERQGMSEAVASVWAARAEGAMFEAYERHGFAYARTFWTMRCDLAEPRRPTGSSRATIHQVSADDDAVLERLRRLSNDTFRNHYGHVPRDDRTFRREVRSAAGYDPSAAWIAVQEGEDVGFLVGSDRIREAGRGYVALLGVQEAARGRGIGRELLLEAFTYYEDLGRTAVDLGVDAENATGATRLYESAGMRTVEVFEVWELIVGVD